MKRIVSFVMAAGMALSLAACGGAVSGASSTGASNGLIRFHDTCALCTELNSFAALADLPDSFKKQERNVVNAAISHVLHPVPSTFF